MLYQLIIELHSDLRTEYENLMALEIDVARSFERHEATLDGHDAGWGKTIIFISTPCPTETFTRVQQLIQRRHSLKIVRAAYREMDSRHETGIWPKETPDPAKVP